MTKYLQVLSIAATLVSLSVVVSGQNAPQDYLTAHNNARAHVGVGNLIWDNTLAAYAQNYVNSWLSDCGLIHSIGPYGENLAKGSGTFNGTAAVALWVAEKKNYSHYYNKCNGGQCLHHTQVVWANSLRLGSARSQCSNGWWFVSCNYDPPRNYIGERPY